MYPELFRESNAEGDEPGSSQSSYQASWGGYDESYCLAQGDIRRFDEISEMSLHKCYMYLANNVARIKEQNRKK